jgi:hypothetical protein
LVGYLFAMGLKSPSKQFTSLKALSAPSLMVPASWVLPK